MSENVLYVVNDLHSARDFLSHYQKPVELMNARGSTRYYGMLTINYIFKTLQKEFPQVVKVIVDTGTDNSALFTAIKLGFKYIKFDDTKIFIDFC